MQSGTQKSRRKAWYTGLSWVPMLLKLDLYLILKKTIPVAVVVALCIGYMIYVAIFRELSFGSSAAIFLYMGLLSGLVMRMPVNKMCACFMNGVKGMATTGMLIGFAYAISGILNAGNVMDTVVNGLASLLGIFPRLLQAPAMLIMHIIINFFVTSGSGQAAITMPIFIPVADLVGMSRQTAVLGLQLRRRLLQLYPSSCRGNHGVCGLCQHSLYQVV